MGYLLIAWDQAPHWGKKEKKIGVGEKKKIGERSEAQGSLGKGKGGPHFLPFSPTAEPVPGYLRRDLNMG